MRAYANLAAAEDAARHALTAHGHPMVPYHCDRCGSWHLCPAERHTPSHTCVSCGKQAYDTEEAAARRAEIQREQRGVSLRVYACPYGDGWHLTSRP
ncbi:MAG: hypothetical protein ABIO70_19380 [Pseudomonadota bacterium]